MTGRHFRNSHLMLNDPVEQLFAMSDPAAERARKLSGARKRVPGSP